MPFREGGRGSLVVEGRRRRGRGSGAAAGRGARRAGDAQDIHQQARDEHQGGVEEDGEIGEGPELDPVLQDQEWPSGHMSDGQGCVLVAVVDARADAGGEPEEGEDKDVKRAPATALLGFSVLQERGRGGHLGMITLSENRFRSAASK